MHRLSDKERTLLELLINGASNRKAANELGIALRTMELHRQQVMRKLGAKSAAQLGYMYGQYSAKGKAVSISQQS